MNKDINYPPINLCTWKIPNKNMNGKGVWNDPIKEEGNIISLETTLEKLKKIYPNFEVKNENEYQKKKYVKKFKGEIKEKSDWMSKFHSESQINTTETWNEGTWCYCHSDRRDKCGGQYIKQKPSEFQGAMKRKPIHSSHKKDPGQG